MVPEATTVEGCEPDGSLSETPVSKLDWDAQFSGVRDEGNATVYIYTIYNNNMDEAQPLVGFTLEIEGQHYLWLP